MRRAPTPPPAARLAQLIVEYQLTPAAVAAGLGWPVEKTEWLLGLRVPDRAPDYRPSLGHAKLDRLAIACELAQVGLFDAVSVYAIAAALATPAAADWVEFTERCRYHRVSYWVGGPAPASQWPEAPAHRHARLRGTVAAVGGLLSVYGRRGDVRARQREWTREAQALTNEECAETLLVWRGAVGDA